MPHPPNIVSVEELTKIMRMMALGYSTRTIRNELGFAPNTVNRYMHLYRHLFPEDTCVCGKRLFHIEWCSFRISISSGRQKTIEDKLGRTINPQTRSRWAKMILRNTEESIRRYKRIDETLAKTDWATLTSILLALQATKQLDPKVKKRKR